MSLRYIILVYNDWKRPITINSFRDHLRRFEGHVFIINVSQLLQQKKEWQLNFILN